jgi:glycerol-3-phosphate dehydrogenase
VNLREPIARDRIRWTYSGVRPLYDDGATKAQEATRDYVLALDAPPGEAPLLSVFGGKITTYRRLAEQALEQLSTTFPHMRASWTRGVTLPGGDLKVGSFEAWASNTAGQYAFLDRQLVHRLCRAYGTRVPILLSGVSASDDLGRDFGSGLSEREVDYLIANEWAETAEDVLWRRTKLGLRVSAEQSVALDDYMRARQATRVAATAVGAQP